MRKNELDTINRQRWLSPEALLSYARYRGWRVLPGQKGSWCGPLILFRGPRFVNLCSVIDWNGVLTWILAEQMPVPRNAREAARVLNQYHRWWSEPGSGSSRNHGPVDWVLENQPNPPRWNHMRLIDSYLRFDGWRFEGDEHAKRTAFCFGTPVWSKGNWRVKFVKHPENPFCGHFVVA